MGLYSQPKKILRKHVKISDGLFEHTLLNYPTIIAINYIIYAVDKAWITKLKTYKLKTTIFLRMLCFWTLSIVLSLSKNTFLFIFQNTAFPKTGFCLRLQVKLTHLGPIGRASPCLSTNSYWIPLRRILWRFTVIRASAGSSLNPLPLKSSLWKCEEIFSFNGSKRLLDLTLRNSQKGIKL
jgi:hypothetical protein